MLLVTGVLQSFLPLDIQIFFAVRLSSFPPVKKSKIQKIVQTFLCWKPPRTALFYKQERDGGRRRGFAPYCIKPFHLHHTVPYHSILLHHTMQNHTNTSPKCTIMHHITPHHKLLSNAHHTSPKCTVPCSVAEKRVGWQKRARGADGHLCQD